MARSKEMDMTKGKTSSLLLKFMLPLVLGNVFQQFYNMADTVIVGQFVGVNALAAVGATGNIMFLILGFVSGLLQGFTVITSQRFGAGDQRGVKQSVGNAGTLSIIVTLIMTLLSVAGMDWLLHVMNTPSGEVYDMAKTYIIIICLGTGCNVLYNLMSSLLRAVGNSQVPLYFLVLSALLNIALDLLLVAVVHMGVAGAALATIISQGVSGILCVIYTYKKVPILVPEKNDWRLDPICSSNQIKIGLPMALQFSITAIGTIMVQSALNLLGTVAMAAYTVACKVEQLFTQFFPAEGMTCATFGGQNVGVGNVKRIREGVRWTLCYNLIYAIAIYLFLFNSYPFFAKMFIDSSTEPEQLAQILEYVKEYIHLCGAFFIPLGMIFIFRNIMQGSGYSFWPMMGGVVELACRAVTAFFATKSGQFIGICYANASSWLVAGLFLLVCYVFVIRRMEKRFSNVPRNVTG